MRRSISNLEVKKLNRNRLYRYVNSKGETSMPEISAALNISGPTVLTIVNELKEAGLVREIGEFKSTGGRKAKAIASVKDVKYAIGLDITKNHVSIVYTDLSGEALKHERVRKAFFADERYFEEVSDIIEDFVEENQIPKDRILGIGVSVPGIVDGENNCITYSHVLGIYNVPCEEIAKKLPYPCIFLNDASAAAITEVSEDDVSGNMVYLFLSNSVGGAIFFGDENGIVSAPEQRDRAAVNMYIGNHWRSAEFGHMVLYPKGRRCYCGKEGCLDAYCSARVLTEETGETLEDFFRKLEEGNSKMKKYWEEYLDNLAIAVDNLRMSFDCRVVLGGYIGNFMEPYIKKLQRKAARKNIFENDGSYVCSSRYQIEASALGVAIYQIEEYIETI